MTRRVGQGMASIVRRTTAQIIEKCEREKSFFPFPKHQSNNLIQISCMNAIHVIYSVYSPSVYVSKLNVVIFVAIILQNALKYSI